MHDSLYKCFRHDEEKTKLQDELRRVSRMQVYAIRDLCNDIIYTCNNTFEDIDDAHGSIRELYADAESALMIIETYEVIDIDISMYHYYDPVPCNSIYIKHPDGSKGIDILDSDLRYLGFV